MDSKTIIKKVLEYDNAPRIGYDFREGYPSDIRWCNGKLPMEGLRAWNKPEDLVKQLPKFAKHADFQGYLRIDEFGNLWAKTLIDVSVGGGEVLVPAIEEWDDLENYVFPDIDNPARFQHIPRYKEENADKFLIGGMPGFPFTIMRYMRKIENFLADLLLEREKVDALGAVVEEKLHHIIDIYADMSLDAISLFEDWGLQDRLFIHPNTWRDVFGPGFERLFGHARRHGMHIIMHSCGYVYDILPDLIKAGVSAMQFDQPTLMGLERISDLFHENKIALYSPVDIQKILPTGDKEKIERAARDMIRLCFRDGGGLIANDYGDYPNVGVKPEWATYARDVFLAEGVR